MTVLAMVLHKGNLIPADDIARDALASLSQDRSATGRKRRKDFIPRLSKECEFCGKSYQWPEHWKRDAWIRSRFCSNTCSAQVSHRTDGDARFNAFIDHSAASGCHLWTGTVGSNGYGKMMMNGKVVIAHRYAYERAFGIIPDGMLVCHKCDTPLCVNTDHHFLGTSADNNRDAASKDRLLFGVNHPLARLNDDAVRLIRSSKKTHTALGAEYGVSKTTIANVRSGRVWRRVR